MNDGILKRYLSMMISRLFATKERMKKKDSEIERTRESEVKKRKEKMGK